MSEEEGSTSAPASALVITERPRFKAQIKENYDIHVPVSIISGISCAPGDYLTFEIIPAFEGHDTLATTSHEIEAKQRMAEADEVGLNTFNYYLPVWLTNFREWLFLTKDKEVKSIDDIPKPETERLGIVVGAGPSLHSSTPEEWEYLKKFNGCIIACNKALVPLLEHGIVPEWVTALDGEEVVLKSFDVSIVQEHKGEINFVGPTVLHSSVTKFVLEWAKECYWGNPHMPSGKDTDRWNVNVVMEILNGLPLLRHGGNVGTAAWLLAKNLKCNPIGMYGFNLCVNPDQTWTRAKGVDFEYLYNPENGETLALDAPFRAYVSILLGATDQAWNEVPIVRTVNLTQRGALFMSGFFPNFTLKDFVENKDVVQRADQDRQSSLKRIADRIAEAREAAKPIFRDDF